MNKDFIDLLNKKGIIISNIELIVIEVVLCVIVVYLFGYGLGKFVSHLQHKL